VLIVLMIFAGIVIFFFQGTAHAAGRTFNKLDLERRMEQCLISKEKNEQLGIQNVICGQENYPASCSICLGPKTYVDKDGDAMPDDCESAESKNNPEKNDCARYYSYSQCCSVNDPCPGQGITCKNERPAKKS